MIYLVAVAAAAGLATLPFIGRLQSEHHSRQRLGHVRHSRGGRGDRPGASGRASAEPDVSRDERVPDPGDPAPTAGARRRGGDHHAHPELAEDPDLLVPRVLQHLQLRDRHARSVGDRQVDSGGRRPDSRRKSQVRGRRPGVLDRPRGNQPRGARPDADARARALDPRVPPVFVPQPLHRARARRSGRRARNLLAHQPLADPVCALADPPDPPLAVRAQARGGGPRRLEDRSLQRASLRPRAQRGDHSRPALRPPPGLDHGRPRPPTGHQQLLRPPRRRRRAQGRRGRLPFGAAPLRRAGALRRRGVQHPPSRDEQRGSAGDRRADQEGSRRALHRRRDVEPAHPGHDLDRRRGVSARWARRERADSPGGPRGLSREAPGPQPGARRDLRAAGRPGRSQAEAGCGPADARPISSRCHRRSS